MKTFAYLAPLVLSRVNAQTPVCNGLQRQFTLGSPNTGIQEAEKDQKFEEFWEKILLGNSGRKTLVRAIKDLDTMEVSNIGWKRRANEAGVLDGIGSADRADLSNYADDSDGEISNNKGVQIWFSRYIVDQIYVGVQFLDQGESLRWKAYLDGEVVQQDIVSGDSDGKVEFNINVNDGFDSIIFAAEGGSSYMLEYIEGCYFDESAPVDTVCTGFNGRFFGDPHILTFDGIYYDCQFVGDLELVKGDGWNIQGRFAPGSFNSTAEAQNQVGYEADHSISIGKAVVFETPGAPKVQVELPYSNEDVCEYKFWVNGVVQTKSDIENWAYDSQLKVVFQEESILFTHLATGSRIIITYKQVGQNGCVMGVDVCLSSSGVALTAISGLFGKPNSDTVDDWTQRDGTQVTIPNTVEGRRFQEAFDYCKTWCVDKIGFPFPMNPSIFDDTIVGKRYSLCNDDFRKFLLSVESNTYRDDTENKMADPLPVEIEEDICLYQDVDLQYSCRLDGANLGSQGASAFAEIEELLTDLHLNPPATNLETRKLAMTFPPTPAPTPSPTPAPTPSPTPSPTPAPTPSPTPAPTPSPTPAPTPAPTPSPTPAPTPSPTLSPTPAPTPSPTPAPTPGPTSVQAVATGDPHITTWSGRKYDFHGVCDLVLLHNPRFPQGFGLDIHVRTKQLKQFSYISSAVLRVGHESLEVMGDTHANLYWINKQRGDNMENGIVGVIKGYPISYRKLSSTQHEFVVDLSDDVLVLMKTFKKFVHVSIKNATPSTFGSSRGLFGTYESGALTSRDNKVIFEDTNEFCQEWQVLPSEEMLFHNVDGPQAPERCEIPQAKNIRRRLSESEVSEEEARTLCAHVDPVVFGMCVFDVMATADKDVAGAY